jgi:hypothetical protein
MDRTHNQDNNSSWNEDAEWPPPSWTGLADSHAGIPLPPERTRTDPLSINRNPVDRAGRRTSSLTFQRMASPLTDKYVSSKDLTNTRQMTLHTSNRRLLGPLVQFRNKCHTLTTCKRRTAERRRYNTPQMTFSRDR